MSLKGKLSKMKNFLFDDEEEEKPTKKSFKKITKVEKPKEEYHEDIEVSEKEEDLYFEDVSEPDNISEIKSRVTKVEKEFNFPEFNDADFMTSPKEDVVVPSIIETPKVSLYQGSKIRKEESKKFKPSPIISPIFGLLDTEGNHVSESESKDLLATDSDDITLDEVRKKAYGNIDEELENTIKKLSKKTIEEAENDAKEEELSRTKVKKISNIDIQPEESVEDNADNEDDDMILPNINFKEIDIDSERKKEVESKSKKIVSMRESKKQIENDEDDDEDTKEQDLFNLIDTMYQGEEKNDND